MAVYTTTEKVKTRLLVPQETRTRPDPDNPGRTITYDQWEDSFLPILTDCISAAEDLLDAYLGRTFRPPSGSETRMFEYKGGPWLKTDDLNGTAAITLTTEDDTAIPAMSYILRRPYPQYNIRRDVRIRSTWPVDEGDYIKIVAEYGWPNVPHPITEAATRAAAELYRSGELKYGMITEPGAGMAYARAPMIAIFKNLRPFRTKSL